MKHKLHSLIKIIIACALIAAILGGCELQDYFSPEAKKQYEGRLAVHFLDVGQGDSIFIELPNDETMLIDAGENYHGEGIINYIKQAGHSRIDYVIGTHPHSDHIGSLPYIIRNFGIGNIYLPNVTANTKLFENLLSSVKSKGLKVKAGKAGVNVVSDTDLSADIIAPVTIDENNLNNCSIVLKLTFGKNTFLFTGDAETGEMGSIKDDISADVLKLGHHGSKNSTTKKLLKAIDPEIAVISCGKNNEYGHPHKEVLQYLKKAKCEVYRTDQQQTITVVSDGNELSVETGGTSIKKAK